MKYAGRGQVDLEIVRSSVELGMRQCGECRMCCKVFPLPILGKAENQRCAFLSPSGCGIHGRGQPEVCRQYACYWLEHEEMAEACRPDRIGVVATESGSVSVAGGLLPILVLNQSEPGACQAPRVQAWIDRMTASGWGLLLIYGLEMQIVYDRNRYPSISEAEIEVAFRYERSQDAEELKGLGAVNDDYQPLTRAEAEDQGGAGGVDRRA